jgi:hypothetical protein
MEKSKLIVYGYALNGVVAANGEVGLAYSSRRKPNAYDT